MSFTEQLYPVQQVLELACAAQRVNKDYVKTHEAIFTDDNKLVAYRHPNRRMIEVTIGATVPLPNEDPLLVPPLLCTNLEDRELATEIQKYYKRLLFAAIDGSNQFHVDLNTTLSSESISKAKFGFVACLPSVYKRDYAKSQFEKKVLLLSPGHIGQIDDWLMDKDCEIISSNKSKTYDAFNIEAIIDNKLVSWMGKNDLKPGNCVVVKAKVKDHTQHWKRPEVCVTRLNYVKAAQ